MLGIDVAKDTLVGALFDPQTRTCQRQWQVPNDPAGVRQLLATVPTAAPWVLEPTGRYSTLAVTTARTAGRTVLLAEPRRAQAFLRSVQGRAKTDRLDSRGLALFALAQTLPPFPQKSPAVEQLEQLLAARKGLSQALMRLRQQAQALPYAAAPLTVAATQLQAQLKTLDGEIAALTADRAANPHRETFRAVAELDRVPGIGPVIAAQVAACLEAKRFTHPDQFVAYIGLDLTVRQSGRQQGPGPLSRRGHAELRRLLYLAAQANVRCTDSPFKDQYARERAKGLASTAALCAVARKLAKVCWSLVQHQTRYTAARVADQHAKSEPAPARPAASAEKSVPRNTPGVDTEP